MPEFQQVLEEIRSEGTDVRALFGGEGTRSPSRRGVQNPQYLASLAEAAKFTQEVLTGRRTASQFMEALSTSDFPILFGDILDRQVLASYRALPEDWRTYAARRTVRDFRTVEELKKPFGATEELEAVKELTEYPERDLEEQPRIQYRVKKYGARLSMSWEMTINDDMGMLRDTPDAFGLAARRTETKNIARLFLSSTGFNTSLYSNSYGNIVNVANGAASNNPVLSMDALQQAFIVLSKQVDENGDPIFIDMVTLVVPPALEVTARNILNATELRIAGDEAGSNQTLITNNWMRNRLQLVVNPYIPHYAATNGNTSWFLFANPEGGQRPALRIAFLRGHEEPAVFMKAPNSQRVGGGLAGVMDGDFETDAIHYKVRHVLGTTVIDPKFTVASNGSGA